MIRKLRVVLIKPSKYDHKGWVQRYRRGFMPNATLPYLAAMTPRMHDGAGITVSTIDEYVHQDTKYLELLKPRWGEHVLVAFVGVQSHQLHRAADLAAYAVENKCMAVIGGPHPMTCDTSMLQGRGVCFCMSEADVSWKDILSDAVVGSLLPVYGEHQRWATEIDPPILMPFSESERKRYLGNMQGIYPARGCPKTCNFCSVIKTAGRKVRNQPIPTTIESLKLAQASGVKLIMFTSDNFNKYSGRKELLEAKIAAGITIPFMCQCDMDIAQQPELVKLMGEANCFQVFLGVESFNRRVLEKVHKGHNKPAKYLEVKQLLAENGIGAHFSIILGFEDDTEESIKDQLEKLKEIQPIRTSFYLLMHIPGTERYGELLPTGVITEKNLDRFDAASPTWIHPTLSDEKLRELFRYCYREMYSVKQMRATVAALKSGHPRLAQQVWPVTKYAAFARYTAWKGENPMSGGVWRVSADHVKEYLPLRRRFYGLGDLFPLPENLNLLEKDEELNRQADDKSWKLASGC